MRKRFLSMIMAIAMLFMAAPYVYANETTAETSAKNGEDTAELAEATNGTCGEHLTWTLDNEGTLTISGTGTMTDYYYDAPWHSSRENIKSVVIEDGVTSIGYRAFMGCSSLTNITIPSGVTSIGDRAFEGCSSLTSVTIPDSVTSIGRNAFSDTGIYNDETKWENDVLYIEKHLIKAKNTLSNEYKIKDGTLCIADYAFSKCRGLTSVIICNSVTAIAVNAFNDCDNLISINVDENNKNYSSLNGNLFNKNKTELIRYAIGKTDTSYAIPEGVTSIGDYAFDYCYRFLRSVTIPDSVIDIGSHAFNDCFRLTSVTIGDSVTSIGEYAFSSCSSLTNITIPNSVTSIGRYAFSYCTGLTSITMPDSGTLIDHHAFYDTGIYKDASNWENGVLYVGNHLIEAKKTVSGKCVIKDSTLCIADYAFSNCDDLTSITIPDSVTSVGAWAFDSCNNLEKVYITDVKSWCNIKFSSNSNPLTCGADLYLNNKLITDLCIPDGVTSVSDHAFEDCNLTSITIPNSVTSIGEDAFNDCDRLTSVTIPDSVTSIGEGAFTSCDNLTSVAIPDSVTSIGEGAFNDCFRLTSIYVDKNNEYYISVDGNLFSKDKTKLIRYAAGKTDISYTIPDSVTSIGEGAFNDCFRLTSVKIPDSVTSIGEGAFYGCDRLTSVTIPDSVTSIGEDAFYSCDRLTSVTIPDSVTSIGRYAFYSCSGLTDVYYGGTKELWKAIKIGSNNSCLTGATIHYNGEGGGNSEPTPSPIPTIEPTEPSPLPLPSSDFEINKYRAEYLLNNTIGSTMETTYFDFGKTPSKILYQGGIDSGLYLSTEVWDAVTDTIDAADSPSELLDYAIEEKDVYSAIIFNMFESATDYRVVKCIDENVAKGTVDLFDNVTSSMKDLYSYNIDWENYNISSMSERDKEKLKKGIDAAFKKQHGITNATSKVAEVADKGLKYATDLKTYCEMVETYHNIYCLSDAMKQVMQEMYNNCSISEPALKEALRECISVMNSSEDAFVNKMAAAFYGVVGKDVLQAVIDKMWDNVKDSFYLAHPGVYLLSAAYKLGKTASNVMFNTDDITEKYFKLAAIVKTENILNSSYKKLKSKYKSDKTEKNAEIYNSVIDVVFNALDTDCDYAYAFADSVGSSAMGKIDAALGDTSVEKIKNSINSIQNNYYNFHETVLTEWIYQLEADNYDQYRKYEHLIDESYTRIKKRYNINCPVDVYIYNSKGELEGSVIDNVPYCSENKNITVEVNGDRKTVYLYNNDEYNIVYVGNDTGTMDISITEYNDNQSEARNVYFNDIELSDGLTYKTTDSDTVSEYIVKDENNKNITADYDTKNVTDTTYTATLTRGYFSDFALSAELHEGENAEIKAYVPDGYKFMGWTSNVGNDIFSDVNSATTTICMPSGNVNITANIVEIPQLLISDFTDTSVTVKALNCGEVSSGKIILVLYDDNNAIKNVYIKDYEEQITFENLNLDGCRIKAMLWDGLETMKPLAYTSK